MMNPTVRITADGKTRPAGEIAARAETVPLLPIRMTAQNMNIQTAANVEAVIVTAQMTMILMMKTSAIAGSVMRSATVFGVPAESGKKREEKRGRIRSEEPARRSAAEKKKRVQRKMRKNRKKFSGVQIPIISRMQQS